MDMMTDAQRRKIFVLAKAKGLDNETLHALIYNSTKKDSMKYLSKTEAVSIIDALEGKKQTPDGRMTGKQEKYILGLAKDLGWTDSGGSVDMARLNGFINERYHIRFHNWLTKETAGQVIEGLKAMKCRAKAKSTADS